MSTNGQERMSTSTGVFVLGDIGAPRYFGVVTVALALLLALLVPEDEALGFPLAFLQWLVQIGVPMVLAVGAHVVLHRARWFERFGPWVQLVVSGTFAAVVFAPIGIALDNLIGTETESFTVTELLGELGGVLPALLLVWMGINAPWVLGFRVVAPEPLASPSGDTIAPASDPPVDTIPAPGHGAAAREREADPEPGLLELVPLPVRGDLVRLKSELHYLEVITTAGRALVLFNLRDAIDRLGADAGVQTHRSHWVARAHVRDFQRRGREAVVMTSDGAEVPVSRGRVADVARFCAALRAPSS